MGDAYTSVTVPATSVDYVLTESLLLHFHVIGYKVLPAAEFPSPRTADRVLHLYISNEVCMISNPTMCCSFQYVHLNIGGSGSPSPPAVCRGQTLRHFRSV